MGQCVLFNTLKSLFGTNESSGSGIQEATPCGAGGTGIQLVQKYASDHARLLFIIFTVMNSIDNVDKYWIPSSQYGGISFKFCDITIIIASP